MADQIDKLAMKKAAAVEDSLANKVTGNQGIFETKDLNPLPSTPTRDALIPKFESTTYQPPEQIIPATLGQATVAGAASMAGELIKGANIVRELPTINPVSTMRAAWGMLGDLAKAEGADQVGEALLTGSTFLKGNSKPSYVSEQINSFADALSSVNDEFAPTPEMARLALQTDAVMQQLAQGSRTKAGVATELALNALSDPSTIANAMSSLIPSIIATLGPGKFVTPLLAAVGRGEQGVTDLEATIAQKYITDTILTSGIPVEDALALRTAAAFSKDGEQLLIVATLAQMMNAEAGIDMAYPVATEREKIESRVYGTLSAMADYGSGHIFNKLNPLSKAAKLRRAMAKAELEGLPLPVAPTQLTVPALLKPAVTAPLEVPSEMGAEYFEQLAKQRGSFAERDAKVNMADVAVAGQLGFAGGFGASAAAVPFTSGTIKKGAAAVVEAAASVAAPIVTKVSDLLSPTAETSSSIAAANAVPAGAVDRSVMTVKGEAVDEAYNPILAMQGILDRGAEYAKDVQAGEVSELLGATFNASTEHLRNALLYVEEVRKSADISQETKDAIFKGVDQLYERHALVTGQMSQKATEMLLDNDLVLTPEDTASARDIVLGSLDIGAQSLEELRALADSPTFASDTAAQSSIGAAIDIATAEDSLRSNLKDTESVKNEFLNGNPDKAGHFGVREYLQRAAAAAQASDVKTLKATAERMERWLKSTEKNKAFIPAVVAQRELELGFLSKAIERVRAMEAEVAGRPAAEANVAAAPLTTTDSPAPTATDVAPPVGSVPAYDKAAVRAQVEDLSEPPIRMNQVVNKLRDFAALYEGDVAGLKDAVIGFADNVYAAMQDKRPVELTDKVADLISSFEDSTVDIRELLANHPATTLGSLVREAERAAAQPVPASGPIADPVGSTPASKVTPSGATPTSVAQAKLDAKAAKDAVAKDASEADKYKAYISSMKRALATQVKDSEAAKDIQDVITKAEAYIAGLSQADPNIESLHWSEVSEEAQELWRKIAAPITTKWNTSGGQDAKVLAQLLADALGVAARNPKYLEQRGELLSMRNLQLETLVPQERVLSPTEIFGGYDVTKMSTAEIWRRLNFTARDLEAAQIGYAEGADKGKQDKLLAVIRRDLKILLDRVPDYPTPTRALVDLIAASNTPLPIPQFKAWLVTHLPKKQQAALKLLIPHISGKNLSGLTLTGIGKITTVGTLEEGASYISGHYSREHRNIAINPFVYLPTQGNAIPAKTVAGTILHELVHAVVDPMYMDNSAYVAKITSIQSRLNQHLATTRRLYPKDTLHFAKYAGSSTVELFSTLIGSPEIGEVLQNIPSSTYKNMFREYVAAIVAQAVKLFGFTAKEGTLLEEALLLLEEVYSGAAPATPVTKAEASKAAKDAYRKSGTDLEKQGAFIKSLEESLATHSDTSKGEGKAIKDLLSAAKQRMVDATTPLAPTVVDDAPSAFDDTGVNYDDDSGDGDQGFIPLAQENGVTDSTEQAAPLGLEEALAAGVLTDVGTVTPTRKGSNEAAPSELLRGKTLLDLIMKPTAEGDRSKGLFRYIVSKGRVIVNNLMLTDAQIFVRAVIAKAKASDPKITQEQLQQLNLAANQLHKQLKADSSLGMLDGLGNTIRPNTNDGVYANKADPLRFLYVVGADGKLALPDTIRAAIQISALNWADSLGRQNTSRDMEGVAQGLFGLGEFDTLPASLFNKYTNIGTNRAVAATAIGKNISKAIGIKFDPTKVPVGFTDNFNTALGLAAIGYLTHKGVVVQPQQSVIPAAEWAADYLEATGTDISGKGLEDITFVQLDLTDAKPSEAVEAAVAAIHQAPSIVDILLSNEAGQVLATSEPSTKVNERTRRNSEVTKRMQDALVKYQGTPNLTNQSLKAILKQPDAQGIIEEVMGLNEFNPNAHHASKREAAKAAVENQKREIARLLGAYARNPEFLDSPIYLKSEFSFQLRNMMTGSDINTQSFKSHRDFVSVESANIVVDKEMLSDENSLGLLVDSIMMSLGADETTQLGALLNANRAFNDIYENIPSDLRFKMQDLLLGNVVSAATIKEIISEFYSIPTVKGLISSLSEQGKAPKGLAGLNTALNIFQLGEVAAGNIESFRGLFEVENDGKTNGFFFLLAQMPIIGDLSSWMERVGIYVDGKSSVRSFNEFKGKDGALDSYQATGSEMLNSGLDPVLKEYLEFFFGTLQNADGSVTSTLRNIMKNPFMIFNYGASLARIKKDGRLMLENAIVEKAESIMEKAREAKAMPEGAKKAAALTEVRADLAEFNTRLNTKFTFATLLEDSGSLKRAIQTHVHDKSYGTDKEAPSTIGTLFGDALAGAIENSMGELAPVRDLVNEVFLHQWRMYDTALTKGIERLEAKGEVSQAEADALIAQLAPLLPHYHGYTGSKGVSSASRIPIFKTEAVVTKDSKVQIKFQGGALGTQKSIQAQALRTKIIDGGVSGFSIAVHTQDAVVMAMLYEANHQLQGRHDAQAVGALDRVTGAQTANKITAEVMSKYSMLHDFVRSGIESLEFAISRGAEVSPESVLLMASKLAELKPLVESIHAKRVELFDNKSVTIDQYPTLLGEGAYTGNMLIQPQPITGFQQVSDAIKSSIAEILKNPPNSLVDFLNGPLLANEASTARAIWAYNKERGITDQPTSAGAVLLDTARRMHEDPNYAQQMADVSPTLRVEFTSSWDTAMSLAGKTMLKGKRIQSADEAKVHSGLMNALRPSPTSATELGLAVTATEETSAEPNEQAIVGADSHIYASLMDESANWLRKSFGSFIGKNKDLVTDPLLLDKSVDLPTRIIAFINGYGSPDSKALYEAFATSQTRVDALNAAIVKANEIAEIVGTESAANATKFSFVPDNAAERVDPVKLAEGADAQVISADSVQTILDTLLSDDLVEVSAETKTVYKALVDKLIGPALGPVTEISLRVKEGIEGIKGTFGALTSAGISIVSGRPNTLNTQSKAEVYLHELTHRFTVEALMKSPVALTALSGLFEQARKALDYTVFLNKDSDGNVVFLTSEDAEIAHAKSMFDYVFNNATRLAGDKGETISVGLLEFVAYALTSPALMSALKDLRVNPTPDSGIKFLDNRAESSLLTKMFNWVYSAFAALTDWMTDSPKGKDVHQRLFNLVMDLNGLQDKHVKANQRSISDKLGSGMDTVNNGVKRYVDGVISALQTKKVANTDLDVLRQTLKIQLVQFGAKLQGMSQADIDKLIEVVDESDDPVKALNALSSKYSILKDEGFVNSIKDTLTGKLSNTAPNIQRTLNRAVSSADRQRETTRSGVTATTKGSFLQRLTATESETMTTALLTSDMVVLVDRYGYEKAGRLMRDNKYLHEEISRLEQSIKSNNPKFAAGMIQQAKGIANVLVKGTGAREMQVSNVGLIVKGAPWPSLKGFEASHNDAVQLHKDLDAYASMQTLAVTTQSSRALASKVWDREFAANSEANGITAAVELHRGAKAAALKQIFDNDPTNVVKGYTPQLFDKNIEWQQANPIRGAELEKLGWKKAFDIDTKIEGGALGMYIRKSNGGSTLMKGAFGLESQQSRGTGIEDAYAESMGGYSGVAVGEIKNRAKRVYEALALRQMGSTYSVGERKNPIGMYNSAGQVVNFSHIMAESTKRELLGKRAMLEEVMGDFAARTVGKRNSEAVNAEVVVALQEDFETNYTKDPESFMWVTSEEWAADGTQNEYFNQFRMLSFDVKKQARELWGDRGIPVRKGFGRVIFGGRKYSIANSKLVNILSDRFPNVPFGGIREIIANLELVWQEVIKIAKVGIVIKTPAVVIMNIVSNMMVLAVNRIDPITASRDAVTGIRELRKYEKLNKEYSVLQLQLRGATTEVGAKRIAIELTRIKSILDSSPIRPLLEEGMFQSIVEDVETSKFGYLDKMTGWLTSKAEDSFGSKAVDIATWLPNQIMMGSDTSVFKFMNKVTQYSDFVARYSYVKQMSARKNAKPMAEIYNGAIENFINYNTPDHAGLQWMNDMGIVMFTKYWLGIQHVITKMFKNQPTEALLSVMGQFALLDIADVMDDSLVNKGVTQVFKSPTDSLDAATKMYGLEFWKNLIPFTN